MTIMDQDSGVALWRRVADSIERGIADGSYPAGERLPGEVEIADAHRVNRHTVRRALAALAERGLVRAERGSGTYVQASKLAYPLHARTRFSEIVGAGGREPRGQLIASGDDVATRELARQLGVKVNAPLLRLETLRFADRVPICVGTTWLSAARFPDAAAIYQRTGSMTKLLAHYGIRDYRRGVSRVTAGIVDASDAARLDLALGRPVLMVDSTDVTLSGEPLQTKHSRFAADRVEFVIESD
ncbi:GntR family phosphonate transport system transcriptional regulator [Rhodopseudomonas rhenobacensis]|uniref:GntR family phosphonate transport system transcriptional regulator n=1 Tax=Rhodopseudomonas rhenobacensis TaxID=87461 RepID=A0A7W7Z877_9BRAD|nr:phosphonate metabolism transcriptional regulator PhnF [Rhodopseudomonas rhenobacensis]MBB5049826.1 GntR family phosphonate transport system transcriptional regulator [Rhodopseudomonas rhenobacensis]